MARGGLYRTDVERARHTLLAQGKNPSLDAIRVELGNTGSKSTIHRHLKEIEAEEGGPVGVKVAVSDALQDLVARLAARLHEEAEARIAELRTQCAAQIAERSQALERQQQEVAGFRTQLERTEVVLVEQTRQRQAAEQAMQASVVTIGQLEERVAGLVARQEEREAHIVSLENKHTHAREALEHFRTSAKEQRDQELRRHEHEVQSLQVQLRQANEALNGKNHELMQLNRDNARMTEQLGQQSKDIRQAQSDRRLLVQQIEELKTNAKSYQALEAQRSKELLVSEQLRAELAAARQAAEGERDRRREAEASTIGLKARVQALADVMAQLRPAAPTSESGSNAAS